MNGRVAMVALTMMTVTLAGCTITSTDSAVICTNLGPIEVELFRDEAPITVQNFVDLARSGYYDGVIFHRIITDFMMQGGDPTGTGRGGEAYGGGNIPDEFHPSLRHDRPGLLSMANAGPDTGSSQFFITFVPTPWLDDKHSIFGEVTDGMDIVERVNAEASSRDGTPQIDVYMQTVIPGGSALDCPGADGVPDLEPATLTAGAITPDTWHITNTEDHLMFWAINQGDTGSIEWTVVDAPEGWDIVFDTYSNRIGAGASTHALAHVVVPDGTSGEHSMTLAANDAKVNVTAHVELDGEPVTQEGSLVTVSYRGYCTGDGEEFDSGEFDTTLGSGQTIAGFDFGLIGLQQGEDATLVLPDELGYGDNPRDPCSDVDPQGLSFDVTIEAIHS